MTKVFFTLFILLQLVSYSQLNVIGARQGSLAGISSPLIDVYSGFNNQAGLSELRQLNAGVFIENRFLIKNLNTSAFVIAVPLKLGTLGIGFSAFGYKLYKQNKYGIGYGIKLSEYLSIGSQLNYHIYQIGEGYGSRYALTGEIGLIAKFSKQIKLATHLFNPTRTSLNKDYNERIPYGLKLGMHYLISEKLSLFTEADKNSSNNLNIKAAAEYKPINEISFRIGISSANPNFCFGAGIKLNNLIIDVCSSYHAVLGFSTQFGMHGSFGKVKSEKILHSK